MPEGGHRHPHRHRPEVEAPKAVADLALAEAVDAARRRAAESAEAGRLHPEVVAALARARLFSLFLPPDLGGPGLGLPGGCEVIARVAEADAAAGWAVMIGAGPGWFAGHMPPGLADEVFAGGGAVAGSGTPGRADRRAEAGGDLAVSGRWRWCSGAPWADWFTFAVQPAGGKAGGQAGALGAGEETEGAGEPPLIVAVPAADVDLDPASWEVAGLRATASWTARLDDVAVPARRTFRVDPAGPQRPEPLFRLPFLAFAQATMAAVSVGAAHAALGGFAALARAKRPWGAPGLLADEPLTRDALARATAAARAAERSLADAVGRVWQACEASPARVAEEDLVDLQLAATHAVANGAAVGAELWALAGMSVLDLASDLGRTVADLHAVSQNAVVSRARFADAGAALLRPTPDPPERRPATGP